MGYSATGVSPIPTLTLPLKGREKYASMLMLALMGRRRIGYGRHDRHNRYNRHNRHASAEGHHTVPCL